MECAWNFYDKNDKDNLEEGMIITGLVSVVFGIWLNASILVTNLRNDPSYKNLTNFISASWFARLIGTMSRILYINFIQGHDAQPTSCKFIALLETFCNVYEVEWLTHLAIERYVIAKYKTNGWPLNMSHYKLYKNLCIFFATLYSVLPLFDIGRYEFDLSCTSCTFDLVLPNSWSKSLVVSIFTLRSIKPVLVMFMMLFWARKLEEDFSISEEYVKQERFTKNIITLTLVNILCWSPLAFIKGSIVVMQLMEMQPYLIVEPVYVNYAMWIQWASPILTTMTLYCADKEIRHKLLNLGPADEKINKNKKDS